MTLEPEKGRDAWLARFATVLHYQQLDPTATLHTALQAMVDMSGAAQGGAIVLDEQGSPQLTALVGFHLEDEHEFWTALISQGLIGFVLHGQQVKIVRNTSTDPRWTGNPNALTSATGSAVGLPLRSVDRSHIVGAIMLIHPQLDYFTTFRIQTLERASDVLGAAVQNALEAEQLRQKTEVFRQLFETAELEKNNLLRDEALRRDLSAMIYHDLRSPLQNIATSLSGLNRVLANTERNISHDLIDLAMRSTQQITRMIKGLLDLERLENGRAVLNQRATSAADLLRDAVELVRPNLTYADQSVTLDVQPDLPALVIDIDMIQRVVVNLLENATKHTPNGGKITVSARQDENNRVLIAVEDTGTGIPPGLRDRVFDKFFRVRYQNAPTGFGLGLAFCRLAVEAHGGRIWVDSEPDHGSTFAFTVPTESIDQRIESRRSAARTS